MVMMYQEPIVLCPEAFAELNAFLGAPDNPLVNDVLKVINKYGKPEDINRCAREARQMPGIMERLRNMDSPYIKDLAWLKDMRDQGAFVTISEFKRQVLGEGAAQGGLNEENAVTLEISALQYFPWLILEAEQAIEKKEIMPGRYIRVRNMQEQEHDQGDILAVAAAMQIMGASYVESLDTRGTDGSNVHLGGAETITGYFGGIGQPNDYPLRWLDEFLYYYTRYGIQEVLNINLGTILVSFILYKLGIDIKFKISVFMGQDNPFAVLWTLMMAKLFARSDGTTPLAGLNVSNSANNETITKVSGIRRQLGFEKDIRIEHHITEAYRHIVRQPYDRLDELVEVVGTVPNISAKHEGGAPAAEVTLAHPSDILDYFRSKEEVLASSAMDDLTKNYLFKHDAVNRTAHKLVQNGFSFIAAEKLHLR
jgi:hypothetical protein